MKLDPSSLRCSLDPVRRQGLPGSLSPAAGDFREKFVQFEQGLRELGEFKQGRTLNLGSIRDTAPIESGDCEVRGIGSLRQTADGFTLTMARSGMLGMGKAVYQYDRTQETIRATLTEPPYKTELVRSGTIENHPRRVTRFTMDLRNEELRDLSVTGDPVTLTQKPPKKPILHTKMMIIDEELKDGWYIQR